MKILCHENLELYSIYQSIVYLNCSCSDSLTVLEVVSRFRLVSLMQLASDTYHNSCLLSLSATRLTTQWLK